MNLPSVLTAVEFMVRAHGSQKRKYTGEPYAVHPASVARMVAEAGGTEAMVVAALLHDVVEDTPIKPGEILTVFGADVCRLVMEVTKVSREIDGNRAARVAMDTVHYSRASPEGQTIKLADLVDNTRTILLHDNGFAMVYMAEKRDLLSRMTRGHAPLYYEARRQVDEFWASEERKGHEQKQAQA